MSGAERQRAFGDRRVQLMMLTRLITYQDYERAEGNCALGIGAILDKNMDTMDDVFYS